MSALTRTEVRGGGCKPYRQKGTGHARQGSIVAPNYVGGGVVFAKKPRDFSQKINKGMKTAAFYSALSEKIRQNEVVVLDKFAIDAVKTKNVAKAVKALDLNGSVLFVLGDYNKDAVVASKNIPNVNVCEANLFNVYEVVATKNIVITTDALKKLEEAVL